MAGQAMPQQAAAPQVGSVSASSELSHNSKYNEIIGKISNEKNELSQPDRYRVDRSQQVCENPYRIWNLPP
jgi:hypothetical protein